eukprot:UN00552
MIKIFKIYFSTTIIHTLYIIAYLITGHQEFCQLLDSLDFKMHETPHLWFSFVKKNWIATTTGNNNANVVVEYKDLQQFAQLLVDLDAVLTIGSRERFW